MATTLDRYLEMLKSLGFKKVLEHKFKMPGNRNETFYVFFQPTDGILFHFDTYLGMRISAGYYYYNWQRRIREGRVYKRKTSLLTEGHWSMHGKRDVFVGQDFVPGHDIGRVIARLKRSGTFVTPWIEAPYLHLAQGKVRMLPEGVRKAILR